ncbi:MAG: hypothetical protein IT160_03885 [Bryobacterales bacterium]|nr:hypothetical protein [Bryobacterales bacterium]
MGLIVSGRVAKPYLSLLKLLGDRLGPVKAPAARVASRMVNRLGAGYPVVGYEGLDAAGLVLLCVEDSRLLPQISREMAASEAAWERHSIMLCHPVAESTGMEALAARQIRLASLWVPEERRGAGFMAEGDRRTIREFRQTFGIPKSAIRVLRQGGKPVYRAGLTFASSLVTPLAAGAVECFRAAGLNPPASYAMLEQAVLGSLRAYRKAGKKGWPGSPGNAGGQFEALERLDPALAEFFLTTARLADERLGRSGPLGSLHRRHRIDKIPGKHSGEIDPGGDIEG